MDARRMPPPGIALSAADVEAVRRFNRVLKYMPRFKMRTRFSPLVIQSLLRLSQAGADKRLVRSGVRVQTLTVQSGGVAIPVRVLYPVGTPRAVVLDFHGGGWVIGNPHMNDAQNAATATACQACVVSVDYRLLPRVSLQTAMDDCLAAARWLLAGGLHDVAGLPIFVVGESAGAHLAATVLLRLKAEPALQAAIHGAVLYYGVYDLSGTAGLRAAGADTLVLDGPGLAKALCMLLPDCDDARRRGADYSPLYADLAGMPPALMFGGKRDPLLDDTLLMAKRWAEAASVELHVIDDAPHGYLHFPTPLATLIPARTHAWMNERLSQASFRTHSASVCSDA